jgi:shikimate dehydrogenase
VPERLAVIGTPIEHSLSPAMQGAALAAAGLPWVYEAERVEVPDLVSAVERLRVTTRGFNVTIPHKTAIVRLLDEVAELAGRVGAVNTVVRMGHRLVGHNTDVPGFKAALLALEPVPSGPAVVFGAGGAGRAVTHALADLDLPVTIVNRTGSRALALAGSIPHAEGLSLEDPLVRGRLALARVVVNATSLGLQERALMPLPGGAWLHPDTVVIDMVYGSTPFLNAARAFGCRAADGVEMLVQQGAASFRLWTGLEPDLDVMRNACHRRLEEVAVC